MSKKDITSHVIEAGRILCQVTDTRTMLCIIAWAEEYLSFLERYSETEKEKRERIIATISNQLRELEFDEKVTK